MGDKTRGKDQKRSATKCVENNRDSSFEAVKRS